MKHGQESALREQRAKMLSGLGVDQLNVKIDKVIEEGRIRRFLTENHLFTVGDIANSVNNIVDPFAGLTLYEQSVLYDAIARVAGTAFDNGRPMFHDVHEEYGDMTIYSLNLFIKDKRPLKKLHDNGYRDVKSLKGIPELILEEIVTTSYMDRFYDLEEKLVRAPEDLLSEIWMKDLDSKRGQMLLKRAKGVTPLEIAGEEGLSRERVRQLINKFYLRQEPYLELVEDRLNRSEDPEGELKKLFADEKSRDVFTMWQIIKSGKRSDYKSRKWRTLDELNTQNH